MQTALCAMAFSSPALPAFADVDAALNLAPILQVRSLVAEADAALVEEVLDGSALKSGGVRAATGSSTCSKVRKIIQLIKIKDQTAVASSYARRSIGRKEAERAIGLGREADERLASLLEADAADALKADDLGMPLPFMPPSKVRLFHRTLVAAQEDLDAVVALFPEDDRVEAARLAGRAYSSSSSSSSQELASSTGAGGGLLPAAGYLAARESRDDAITRGIDALPNRPRDGRVNLQNRLDNEWREQQASNAVR